MWVKETERNERNTQLNRAVCVDTVVIDRERVHKRIVMPTRVVLLWKTETRDTNLHLSRDAFGSEA